MSSIQQNVSVHKHMDKFNKNLITDHEDMYRVN